jgi:hypothetical protein
MLRKNTYQFSFLFAAFFLTHTFFAITHYAFLFTGFFLDFFASVLMTFKFDQALGYAEPLRLDIALALAICAFVIFAMMHLVIFNHRISHYAIPRNPRLIGAPQSASGL